MPFATLIARIWSAIPAPLQRFLGYGISAGVALVMVLALWLFWGTGIIQDRLSIPTRADIKAQTKELKEDRSSDIKAILSEYDASIKGYLHTERQLAKDTILHPILDALSTLDRNQRTILTRQTATDRSVQRMPGAINDQLERLMETNSPVRLEEQIRKMREESRLREERHAEELEELREEIRHSGRKKKSSQTF